MAIDAPGDDMNTNLKISGAALGIAIVASTAACVPDPYSQENGHTTNTQVPQLYPAAYVPADQPIYVPPATVYAPTPAYTYTYTVTEPAYASAIVAPVAPPPPRAELIPPAPAASMVWQAGHWSYNGTSWDW